MTTDDPSVWTLAASLISAAAAFVLAKITGKQTRQAELEKFKDEVFKTVNVKLEECEKREKRMIVIEGCFRLTMNEILRTDPRNSILRQVRSMLEALPYDPEVPNDMISLLDQLRKVPWPVNNGGSDEAQTG